MKFNPTVIESQPNPAASEGFHGGVLPQNLKSLRKYGVGMLRLKAPKKFLPGQLREHFQGE
jgi:hypothetical protein